MMKKLLLSLLIAFNFIISNASAQSITPVQMDDANLTTTNVQNFISTSNVFSAPRTLTIPPRSSLNAYYIQFTDTVGAVSTLNTLTIRVADGTSINGASTLVLNVPNAYLVIVPSGSGYFASINYNGVGSPGGTNGQIQYNNAGNFGGFTASGDLTANTATGVFTFGTVNANVGTFGSATQCANVTVNAKGLVTAAGQNLCTPAIASVTGLGTGIATALAANIGSVGAPVLFNGAGGTPSSLVGTNITGTAAGLTAGTANAVAVGGITGLGTGCATWLATPSSANLRGCLTDETGTGLAYFQGGALGTPASGTLTNATGLVPSTGVAATGTPSATTYLRGDNTWSSPAGAGTVTSIAAGTGLSASPSPITASGTLSLSAARQTLPTVQTFTSGSGTYTTPTNVLWIEVQCVGGGGGGGGSGTSAGSGGSGGPTTFGSALLTCNGGNGGLSNGTSTTGGSSTGGYQNWTGGTGGAGVGLTNSAGGLGGSTTFGGGGSGGGAAGASPVSPPANTGVGGGGGGEGATNNGGSGGGGGGSLRAIINSPSATYSYAVGAAGTAGSTGTGGVGGAPGSSGLLMIIEHYGT